jgi:hypothetical protein
MAQDMHIISYFTCHLAVQPCSPLYVSANELADILESNSEQFCIVSNL